METWPVGFAEYLAGVSGDRARAVEAVLEVVREKLTPGLEMGMQYGMPSVFVPHSVYPAGYHCEKSQPVPYLSVGAQKHHLGLYLFCVYMDDGVRSWFEEAWQGTGRRLDMGKSCVRFKKLEDVPLEVVGELVGRVSGAEFLARYVGSLRR